MQKDITHILEKSLAVKQHMASDGELVRMLEKVAEAMVHCYRNDGKILFCGNGGSAADAQHISAELSGRFYLDRPPLYAEALHVNTSFLTAVANDYGYDDVFARMVRAAGRSGDILFGLTTSGNSVNVRRALTAAREIGMTTVGMTGANGISLAVDCDFLLVTPSTDTPRIQEGHITMGHILCELVEKVLFVQ